MTDQLRPMAFALQTPRMSLRLRDTGDAEWDLELLGEREGGTTRTLAQVRERLAEQHAQAQATGIGLLAIERRPEGGVIGYCGLIVGRATLEGPELAYELFRRAHGHGYATEAARAVLDAAFATGRERVRSTVRAWNAPSFRVLEKLGFRRERSVTDERGELVHLVCDA